MDVIFLGTNGWYDTDTGNTVCILIKSSDHTVILDAGNGFYKIDSHLTGGKRRTGYLLLSHFHLDHVEGLHMLNKVKSFERLVIAGPKGTRSVLNTLVNSPFTMPLSKLPYPVEIVELPDETERIPFPVRSEPLLHADLTLGYRVDLSGKIVAYCPDTGYCENAVKLARNAELLITECAYRSGEEHPEWPHLNPESAARIAREAGARRLALAHFDASRYKTMDDRKDAERRARGVFGDTIAAADGTRITV